MEHMISDFWIVCQWWGTLFLVGAAAYPFTKLLFGTPGRGAGIAWYDHGYLFTKAVGMAMVTYIIYIGGMTHLLPFTIGAVWGALILLFVGGIVLQVRLAKSESSKERWKHSVVIGLEEVFFFGALVCWSWVKAHEPSIHGLEKFMDFGFTQSILDSRFFPAPDMWYSGLSINYYYFGHTVMAVLTRLSGINLAQTFNLMLATIFAFTLTMSFGISVQLLRFGKQKLTALGQICGGLLTAFLVTLAGNMQTIYSFTKGYTGDAVVPFWTIAWGLQEFWQKLPEGLNRYWYANATRFIPYTIHEFPSYSFVVSDVHGHVLSLPFVLLALGLLVHIFGGAWGKEKRNLWVLYIFYGFLCSVLLMTNALDGPIYFGLFTMIYIIVGKHSWKETGLVIASIGLTTGLVSVPFLAHFKSFVTGIAVNCPPAFIANTHIGPLLFEGVEKCQHSPLWMWWLLWGFFVYCGIFLFVPLVKKLRMNTKVDQWEMVLGIWFVFALILLVFPEFLYFKDIYPMHFRSNTMFKLGYQAFIMLSMLSGYVIAQKVIKLFTRATNPVVRSKLFFLLLIPQLFLVAIYPIFSVRSYFGELRNYQGLDGLTWFRLQYPDDWAGISWLNTMVRDRQFTHTPVIVEADGDSYTDYDRVSTFTGLPTIQGWAVHEWLWRGTYDVVAPRREDVRVIYESKDLAQTRQLLEKYQVEYVFVGTLEREKFKELEESKFYTLGKAVFTHGQTVIYKVSTVK